MQQRQIDTQQMQKEACKSEAVLERKPLGSMLLIVSITTIIFVVHNIIAGSMNYESWRAPMICYFTIQSNIIIGIWFAALGMYMLNGAKVLKWSVNVNVSAIVTTYILVTGIIYWTVLIPMYARPGESVWMFSASNIWLHTTSPVIAYLMHRYARALRGGENTKLNLLYFYIYPALYIILGVVYAANGTYLYPMFNPTLLGWLGVAVSLLIMLVVFSGLYILLLRRKRVHKDSIQEESLGEAVGAGK